MKIALIPSYFIYCGLQKDLDASMVYQRLMNSTKTSYMHSHALIFMRSCIIVQWRLNDAKPFLPQSQFFGILPPDARGWEHSHFSQIFPNHHIVMAGQQCPTPTGPQKRPTNNQQIPPLKINTSEILVYQLDASAIQTLLTQITMIEVGDTQRSAQ